MVGTRFLLESDADTASDISKALRNEAGAEVHESAKRSLDGSPETVLQVVELGLQALSTALPLVLLWVGRGKVRKIRLGDIEIDDPTPDEVDVLWQDYLDRRGDAKRPGPS